MAIIGKIREKSALLVIIIGIALLAFILGDWRKTSFGSEEQIGYGTVYGERVDFKRFEENSAKFQEQDRQQAQQQQKEYTQVEQDASIEKAWNYLTETILFEKEYDALGIDVSENEFDSYLYGRDGFQVMPELVQGFTDPKTGLFNEKMLQKRIQEMESSSDPKVQKQWEDSKTYYTDRRKQEKYFALINQGLYVTKLEAQEEYLASKEIKSISYVVRRYSEIDDKDVKITDEALKNYYEEHKGDKKYMNQLTQADKQFLDAQIKEKQTMRERAEQARTFDEQITFLINQLKVYLLPLVKTMNDRLIPKIDGLVKKFTDEGWGDKIEKFAETVGG